MSTIAQMIMYGAASGLPAASIPGRVYIETDTGAVRRDNGTTWDQITVLMFHGATGSRPTVTGVGFQYFDTTLGIPIFWSGTAWVNASGTPV